LRVATRYNSNRIRMQTELAPELPLCSGRAGSLAQR
jgi:hypothetical protein